MKKALLGSILAITSPIVLANSCEKIISNTEQGETIYYVKSAVIPHWNK